jgi:hypothetical protein
MYFLYGELFVLMAVSFGVGAMLATTVMRIFVRRTEAQVNAETATNQALYPGASS